MKSFFELPQNYKETFRVNFNKDKKTSLLINFSAVAIALVMIRLPGFFGKSIKLFRSEPLLFQLSVFIFVVLYFILHELVHGIFIRIFSGKKASYAFKGLYACAGSKAYFNKVHYIIIALAPVVIWGLVLAVLNIFVSNRLFWHIYFIQLFNIAGATGDFYITVKMLTMPKATLVQDSGIEMAFYCEKK